MEKVIEKKETSKKEDVKVDAKYVKASEMTKEDIDKLPRFIGSLVKTKSKRGQIYYSLVVQLDPLLSITKRIDTTPYNLIVTKRELSFDKPIQYLEIPVRLIKGISDTGKQWYRYEFYICGNVRFSDFFNDMEIALIEAAKIQLKFIESPDKFDDELINAFNEEAYR